MGSATDLAHLLAESNNLCTRLRQAAIFLETQVPTPIPARLGLPAIPEAAILSLDDAKLIAEVLRDSLELIVNAQLEAAHEARMETNRRAQAS